MKNDRLSLEFTLPVLIFFSPSAIISGKALQKIMLISKCKFFQIRNMQKNGQKSENDATNKGTIINDRNINYR